MWRGNISSVMLIGSSRRVRSQCFATGEARVDFRVARRRRYMWRKVVVLLWWTVDDLIEIDAMEMEATIEKKPIR